MDVGPRARAADLWQPCVVEVTGDDLQTSGLGIYSSPSLRLRGIGIYTSRNSSPSPPADVGRGRRYQATSGLGDHRSRKNVLPAGGRPIRDRPWPDLRGSTRTRSRCIRGRVRGVAVRSGRRGTGVIRSVAACGRSAIATGGGARRISGPLGAARGGGARVCDVAMSRLAGGVGSPHAASEDRTGAVPWPGIWPVVAAGD